MSVEQITKSQIKKHFITDLITAIDEDLQDGNEDHVYKLFNVMLGFTPNQEILTDYITGELNQNG